MKGWQLLDEKGELGFRDFVVSDQGGTTVSIQASALNHRDVWIQKGLYPGVKPGIILGSDGAGILNGKDVIINPGFSWGDNERCQSGVFQILGVPGHGTFADSCNVSKEYIYPKPDHLTVFQAAALPLAGVTAYRSLFSRGQTTSGDTVLINGLGGGVALLATQMALAIGCNVIGTTGSEWKEEKALQLGVSKIYNYRDVDWAKKCLKEVGGADVIIDSAGGKGFNNLLKVARPGGRIVTYGGTTGKITEISPQIIFWKQLSVLGSTMGSNQDFNDMLDFISNYKIEPIIDEIIPLSEIIRGFRKMEEGTQFGKLVFDHSA